MNIIVLIKHSRSALLLLVLLVLGQLVWLAPARAVTVGVYAEFTPSLNNPNNKTFTNTSPLSGVCSNAHKDWCKANNVFSIGIPSTGTKRGNGVADFGRSSIFFGLPEQRVITVVSDTGETADVIFRITGMAFRYVHGDMPEDGWRSDLTEIRGCRIAFSNNNHTNSLMRIIMRDDNGAGGRSSCAFKMLADREFGNYAWDIVYEIETPEPLNMKNGVYKGIAHYTRGGAGADFDMGDGATFADPFVYIGFQLTVNHLFAIDFAPGYETVNLQPLGGWNQWQEFGKVPATLRRDVPFRVSGSTDFAVDINCEYTMPDGRCGISNGPSTVPLDIAITMPGLVGHKGGMIAEALNYPLQKDVFVPRFSPMREGAVFQRPSYLRFEVNGDPIKEMVTHPSTEYKGRVTVIFDANI
ncbi:hypothetical protein WG29040_06190 [Pseudomonas sp. PAMC 29040]|uniref:hypothetical protein n=1 Tax=Pseudomonas sp. PAMC 29040 TaxID=2498450 RepID=UPI000FA6DE23|nr:hypothetical protein [Pseudomonas sp. PAMC 29040]RUT39900.1 hypothetical protein WG29040_06190 [Pseudomonas sp. PAMC 29040]